MSQGYANRSFAPFAMTTAPGFPRLADRSFSRFHMLAADPLFMSFPKDTSQFADGRRRIIGHVNDGAIIENTSFEDLPGPLFSDVNTTNLDAQTNIAIYLENVDNVIIRNNDFRHVSEPIFAKSCDNLRVEFQRYENCGYPNHRAFATAGFDRHFGNFLQLDDCQGTILDVVKGRYSDGEDMISHFQSGASVMTNYHHEGGSSITRPTTDATDAIVPGWLGIGSWGGFSTGACTPCVAAFNSCAIASTGMIFGDQPAGAGGDASNIILINSGRVPVHITGGENNAYDKVIVYNGEYTAGMGARVGDHMDHSHAEAVSIFNASPPDPCSGHSVTNSRTWYDKCDGTENPSAFCSGCGTCDFTGTVFGDVTLDIDDWRIASMDTYDIPVV